MEIESVAAVDAGIVPWSDVRSSGSGHIRVLVKALEPELAAIAGIFRMRQEDADDALQDTLASLFVHRWKIRDLRLWTRRVFWNRCLRWARDSRRESNVSLESIPRSEEIAELQTHPCDAGMLLEQALSALSPRHRQILWQARVARYTWSELAAELGCTRAGAKKAVYRAMKEARREVAERASRRGVPAGGQPPVS